jgi:hypothetical protein
MKTDNFRFIGVAIFCVYLASCSTVSKSYPGPFSSESGHDLPYGKLVRIVTRSGDSFKGKLTYTEASTVMVGEQRVPYDEIKRIEVMRSQSKTALGIGLTVLLIGALAAAMAGGSGGPGSCAVTC